LQRPSFRSNHPKNIKSLSIQNISDGLSEKIMAGFDPTANRGADCVRAVQEMSKAIDRADRLLQL
jgi:hypothetical protein